VKPPRLLRSTFALLFAIVFAFAAQGCADDRSTASDTSDAAGANDAMPADAAAAADPPCTTDEGPVDPTVLIDDFEDATSDAPQIAGRAGAWFTSGDATAGATMKPLGLAAPEPIPGGRCGSRHALHVTGSGFLDWGSQVTLALDYGADAAGAMGDLPYDARTRGYQGVTFFARVGEAATNLVRFGVSDQYARPEAGLCSTDSTSDIQCYDSFGVVLAPTLSTSWSRFRIPWTDLSQRHFGLQGGDVPDTSKLYELAFAFPDGVVFDLWLDDIRFY
jgi:hypothetical protein